MPKLTKQLATTGLIRISGPDGRKFLQGQTTCQIDDLREDNAIIGAFCNPKGRIKTTFLLIEESDDVLLMLMDAGQCDYVLAELTPYVAFFKAELTNASGDYLVAGLLISDEVRTDHNHEFTVSRKDDGVQIEMPGQYHRALLIGTPDSDLSAYQQAELPWDAMDIEDGLVWIDEARRELLLPHDVNLPGIGGVSYEKGCYTGQEIVARMHFRGNPKYTAAVLEFNTSDLPKTQKLEGVNQAGETIKLGQAISAPQVKDGKTVMLASVSKDLLGESQIRLSIASETSILCTVLKPFLGQE